MNHKYAVAVLTVCLRYIALPKCYSPSNPKLPPIEMDLRNNAIVFDILVFFSNRKNLFELKFKYIT